jgi:hypothetical protein
MTDATSPSDKQVIKHALLCASCSYNLQSLPADALCPECAKPISETLRGDLLALADPIWVKKLYRGTLLVTIAVLLPLILYVGLIVTLIIFVMTYHHTTADKAEQIIIILFWILTVLAAMTASWGAVLATSPEPFRQDSQHDRFRKHTRWSGVLWASMLFLILLHATSSFHAVALPKNLLDAAWFCSFSIAPAYHYWAVTHYIQALALRIPDLDLAETARKRRTRMILWTTVGFFLLGVGPLVAFIIYLTTIQRLCNGLERVVEDIKLRQLAAASTADSNS